MIKITIQLENSAIWIFYKPNYYSDIIQDFAFEAACNFSHNIYHDNINHIDHITIELK